MDAVNPEHHRLSRDEWLEQALEVTSRKPHGKLRIHELVKHLGVTRGSFYWHFKDREDFVRSLGEYWDRWSTDQVIHAVERRVKCPGPVRWILPLMLLLAISCSTTRPLLAAG
jgi:AcrR family transcriptional regulator